MRAVLTVVGKDAVGILARVAGECAKYGVNISEVSQTVLQEMFCMIMLCDLSKLTVDFGEFADRMKAVGDETGMAVQVMHSDIFDSMHRI